MIEVFEATSSEIDRLVELESALFAEDAARHDPFADPTWPARAGAKDFERLIASADAIVLTARLSDEVVGLLVGYVQAASPTRQPVKFAILRSLYVSHTARRHGIAAALTRQFLEWAKDRECAEAHVDHYAANREAAAFYAQCGFAPRSVSRALRL